MSVQGQAFRVASDDSPALPGEIAFLAAHGVPIELLRRVADTAQATGVHADQVLIREDWLPEGEFYRALAIELGLPFVGSGLKLGPGTRFPHNCRYGVGPLADPTDGPSLAIAPYSEALAWVLALPRPLPRGLVVTTPSLLTAAVLRARAGEIILRAAKSLADAEPHRSCLDGCTLAQRAAAALGAGTLGAAVILAPRITMTAVTLLSASLFFAMVVIRIAASRERAPVSIDAGLPGMNDRDLPIYTVIVPLYREARVFGQLVRALEALDYPRAKLQAMLVIEADDPQMAAAVAGARVPGFCEVVVAPPGLPRTKPRALNIALPLARGAFTVVYDAEDVPEPDQLRAAVATFAAARPDVACLQARLAIDNTNDNWLTRLFTIEYATLFDVINPGLVKLDIPISLGGTSNHFRTSVLEELHGWDAWNVTEDADLGIRLALSGYRVDDLPSTTWEEAPSTLPAWLRQRTRWMKGFMQVIVSHSRNPIRTLRDLGPFRFFATVSLTLGTVATALGYPFFVAIVIAWILSGSLPGDAHPIGTLEAAVGLNLLAAGFVAITAPAITALRRRGWLARLWPFVGVLPLYFALMTVAAWRGLYELALQPFRWNKTEHGLARTSRTGRPTTNPEAPARPPRPDGSG